MSKARTLANLISDNAELADGQISVAEVVGAAPTANPTFTGNIDAGDNVKIRLGDSDDLQLYHNGSDSIIADAGTGNLNIQSNSTQINLQKADGTKMLEAINNGNVVLYSNGVERLRANGTGIDVTGAVTSDGLTVGGTTDLGASIMTVVGAAGNHNTFAVGAGTNNSVTLGNFNTNDTIANLITSSSKFGGVIQGGRNGSLVLGIRDNDVTDGIFVMSGTGTGGGQISNDYSRLRLSITPTTFVINETGDDADFRVESDSQTHALFVDAGNNRIGMGEADPDAPLHLKTSETGTAVKIESTNGGTGHGPNLRLLRSSPTPADNDMIGRVNINGMNSAGEELTYAQILGQIRDVTDGTEDSRLKLGGQQGGTFVNYFDAEPTETVINQDGVDRDFRVESNNKSQMMLIDGGQDRVAFGNGDTSRAFFTIDNDSGESTKPTLYVEGYPASAPTSIIRRDNTDSQYVLELHHDAPVSGSGGTGYMLQFADRTGVELGSIKSEGNSGTTYNTTSDRRLKTSIQPIVDATDKLMSMKPVTHTWKANPEGQAIHGFIAQEMQEIVPEAVSGEDGGEEMMSMDYGRITPVLVAALQEATNEIKALKQRVSELEAI